MHTLLNNIHNGPLKQAPKLTTKSREHLGKGINLTLLNLLDALWIGCKICGTGGCVLAEKGRLRTFGNRFQIMSACPSLRLPLLRRSTKDVTDRVRVLPTRQLVELPRNTIHKLDVPGNVGLLDAGPPARR